MKRTNQLRNWKKVLIKVNLELNLWNLPNINFLIKKLSYKNPPIENSVNKKEEEEEEEEKSRSCIEIVLDDRCEQFSEDEKNEV